MSKTLFYVDKLKNDSSVYFQRLINDINNGRYDNKPTPHALHLNYVQEKGLTSYMNNTKWNKVFDIICSMEEKAGREISFMYKCIFDAEDSIHY